MTNNLKQAGMPVGFLASDSNIVPIKHRFNLPLEEKFIPASQIFSDLPDSYNSA